MALPNHIIR